MNFNYSGLPCRNGLLVLSLIVLAGCGSGEREPGTDIRDYQGQVDTSLPEEQQQQQKALKRVLDDIGRGILPDEVEQNLQGIKVQIDTDPFYEKAIGMEKWVFKGPPDGEFQTTIVTLRYEDLANRRIDLRDHERTFRVTGTPGSHVVQLVP